MGTTVRIGAWLGLFILHMPLWAELKPETRQAFEQYVRTVEQRMERDAAAGKFLALGQVKQSDISTQEAKDNKVEVPHGQIQHWIGAVFFPGANMDKVKSIMQDYDNYQRIYHPDVTQSKLLKRSGDDFDVFLKLYKKQIISVVFDTTYRIHYRTVDPKRMTITSKATRIAEVEYGKEKTPGEDHGFLWALDSYWRFLEADGGVYAECEAISLSRDVPALLHAVVGSFLKKFPVESMRNTLQCTKKEVASR